MFSSPAASQAAGISTVYQEVNLCTNLTVAENMLLGREPRRFGGINVRAMNRRARETLDRPRPDIDPASQLGEHPIAVQQLVAIARAVDVDAQVLILDEPTSSLDADEVAKLFEVMRTAARAGRRDRLRLALPRPGLRDRRPHDGPAQRRAGRGAHGRGRLSQLELVRLMIGRELEALERLDREIAATDVQRDRDPGAQGARPGPQGLARGGRPRAVRGRGRRRRRAARLRSHRARPAALRRRHRRHRRAGGALRSGAGSAARGTRSTARSRSPARTARPRASSATSPSPTTCCWRCRRRAAGCGRSRRRPATRLVERVHRGARHPARRPERR